MEKRIKHTKSGNRTETDIDRAVKKIYQPYWPDLFAFVHDVETRLATERSESMGD